MIRTKFNHAALAAGLCLLTAWGNPLLANAAEGTSPAGTASGDADGQMEWSDVVAAAENEGEVVVYLSEAGVDLIVKEAFEAKYPKIKVVPFRAASGELIARAEEERRTGISGADILWTPEFEYYKELANADALRPIQLGPNGQNWAGSDAVSQFIIEPYQRTFVMGFNTNQVEPFSDAKELLRPDLKGRIGIQEPFNPPNAAQWQVWIDDKDPDFLKRLAEQNPKLYATSPPQAAELAAGEIAVSAMISAGPLQTLKEQGAPVDWRVYDAAASFAYGIILPKGSTHPNAAAVFLDWMMSAEAQELLAKSFGGAIVSPLPNIQGTVPKDNIVLRLDPTEWPAERVKEIRSMVNSLFLR